MKAGKVTRQAGVTEMGGVRLRTGPIAVTGPAVSLTCFLLFITSCSFNYGTKVEAEANLPDLTMTGLAYVHVKDGKPLVSFSAETADRYEKSQTMELQDAAFKQLQQENGKTAVEAAASGSADKVHIDTKTNNITLNGNVNVYSKQEDVTITSPTLSWENSQRMLSSGADDTVTITRKDGSSLEGEGFSANTRSRTWQFNGPVSGVYNNDNDKTK
jgi:LPS export ABC transporter protein LptC